MAELQTRTLGRSGMTPKAMGMGGAWWGAGTKEDCIAAIHRALDLAEALLSAVPQPDPEARVERIILSGEVADPAHHPSGCRFHPRCPCAQEVCKTTAPATEERSPGHSVSCHFAGELTLKGVG